MFHKNPIKSNYFDFLFDDYTLLLVV